MATKPYKWRKTPTGVEGTYTVYVDSATGSDLWGEGTRANPYQTLGKAYRGTATKPTRIICRGRFSESMADGNNTCKIEGDYYGAAVFDGAGYFLIYGFSHKDLIIVNTGIGTDGLVVYAGSGLVAGVGTWAIVVGDYNHVKGVNGSSVLIDNSSLYFGVIGGTSDVKYVCFSRPKAGYYPISLRTFQSDIITHDTIYGCRIANRQRRLSGEFKCASSVFADFDMFADETMTFTQCLFASDCLWYYKDLIETGKPQLKIVVDTLSTSETVVFTANVENGTMTIGGGGVTGIPSAIDALYVATRITVKPTFTSCLFTDETAADIFNNPTKQDFTLKPNGSGVISADAYYGAFPPALSIPIMDDSTGVPATWDEHTCDGLIEVVNDEICIDEDSAATAGSIQSKIVQINPSLVTISAIFSAYASKFTDYGCALWKENLIGQSYSAGDVLPIGRYLVKGAVVYDGNLLENKSVVVVQSENTTFINDNVVSSLVQLLDANVSDVVYVRTIAAIYVRIKHGDGLQRGATYLNCGNANITYRNRTIVPGESFVAENAVDDFTANDSAYEIGVMFDDTRVPSSEWIPAQLFGEYFVCRERGTVKLDASGIPVASGNYLSWQPAANGGYANLTGLRTPIKQRYIQFRFDIKCVYDSFN